MPRARRVVTIAAVFHVLSVGAVAAQETHGHMGGAEPGGPAVHVDASARAILLLTHLTPAVGGESTTEGYVTQPVVMARAGAFHDALRFTGTLDLEGLTLDRGELNAGAWGEGYVDRRHPHTYLHEAVLSGTLRRGMGAASLSAGKGFVPFGTDDPMMRPFVKYPSNHHLAQILERAVVIGGARYGPLLLEGALFNGDEPTSPGDGPNLDRFGDSWAARLTLGLADGVELQGSHAFVASPEHDAGGGLDQTKWSASFRLDRPELDWGPYALVEWALTREGHAGAWSYEFRSVLAEAALRRGRVAVAARLERSERPEEERLLQDYPFRAVRPASDFAILARSRWDIATVHLELRPGWAPPLAASPFVEASFARVRNMTPGSLFDPADVFGSDRLWSLSIGARLGVGPAHSRMGRYGVAAAAMIVH